MTILYFGYGSNLCLTRLRTRVPDAEFVCRAWLPKHRLRWHKRSSIDGSGKCSISPDPEGEAVVHGALFTFPQEQKSGLDRVEGLGAGYEETGVLVETAGGTRGAYTYVADPDWTDDSLAPFSWYRDLVAAGGEALGLPDAYLRRIRDVRTEDDPDAARDARERRVLPCRDGTREETLREEPS